MDKITHEVRKEQWMAIMEECLASGKPKTTWCRENGISEKQFFYWQRILRKDSYLEKNKKHTEITPVAVPDSSTVAIPFIELQQPTEGTKKSDFEADIIIRTNNLTIEISNTASDSLLARIGGLLHAQ